MSNLIDRLNSLTEREKSNMSNVAGSFRKIFDSWPIIVNNITAAYKILMEIYSSKTTD